MNLSMIKLIEFNQGFRHVALFLFLFSQGSNAVSALSQVHENCSFFDSVQHFGSTSVFSGGENESPAPKMIFAGANCNLSDLLAAFENFMLFVLFLSVFVISIRHCNISSTSRILQDATLALSFLRSEFTLLIAQSY